MKCFIASIFFVLLLLLSGCSSFQTHSANHKPAELTVHYNSKQVYKRHSSYSSRQDLNKLINKKEPFAIIFAADWCKSCVTLKRALKKIKTDKQVLFLNADKPWVRRLMQVMQITGIPCMVDSDNGDNITSIQLGTGKIITYLLIRR